MLRAALTHIGRVLLASWYYEMWDVPWRSCCILIRTGLPCDSQVEQVGLFQNITKAASERGKGVRQMLRNGVGGRFCLKRSANLPHGVGTDSTLIYHTPHVMFVTSACGSAFKLGQGPSESDVKRCQRSTTLPFSFLCERVIHANRVPSERLTYKRFTKSPLCVYRIRRFRIRLTCLHRAVRNNSRYTAARSYL